jgi:hypothetical protein
MKKTYEITFKIFTKRETTTGTFSYTTRTSRWKMKPEIDKILKGMDTKGKTHKFEKLRFTNY